MNPRLRRLFRRPARVLAALATLFVLGSSGLWIFRTNTLEYLAKRTLEDFGFEDPQLTLAKAEFGSLEITNVRLSSQGNTIALEKLEIGFSLSELLKKQRLRTLTLYAAEATLALENAANDTPPPTLEALLKQLDLSAYAPLPFDRIQIIDSTATLIHGTATFSASIEAELIAQTPDSLSLTATLARPTESLEIAATLSSAHDTTVAATLQLASPIETFDTLLPAWQKQLPPFQTLSAGPLQADLHLAAEGNATPELSLTLSLQDLLFEDGETTARISQLSSTATITSWDRIPIQLTLTPQQLSYDTIAIAPDAPIKITAELTKQSVVDFQTHAPFAWSYDDEFVHAQSTVTARYDLSDPARTFQAEITTSELKLEEARISPFVLSIEGNAQELEFHSSQLSSSDYPQAALAPGTGTLRIPESDTDPITLTFNSQLRPAPLLLNEQAATLPRFDLSLTTRVYEAATQSQLKLTSLPAQTLATLPGLAELKGQLNFKADINEDSATEHFSGELTLDASEISIHSDSLKGDGIGLQAKLAFQDLLSEDFAEEAFNNPTLLTGLLRRTTTNIDWQANHLQAGGLKAQWSGGSASLKTENEHFLVASDFGSGILKTDTLKLEQLYVENALRGTLESLTGTTQVSALLDGSPVTLSSRQTLTNPLSDLSLTGEYTLSPISYVHSDLPARFSPELAGLSFSAQTQANGRFQASLDSADATLSLSLRQGSLSYPASQLKASGFELDLELDSLATLDSGDTTSRIAILTIDAGDAQASDAQVRFRIRDGKTLSIGTATITFFGGQASLESTDIPIDGSDFQGQLSLKNLSLAEIARYIEVFDGSMDGQVSGYLPFQLKKGSFELLRGALNLPEGTPATLRYQTQGLLTKDAEPLPHTKPTFSERLLKFLKVDPELSAEQALGNITITDFEAELFPEDSPDTPIRIRIAGIAHAALGDIPVEINTQVNGSLSELYNFLIRLNSL